VAEAELAVVVVLYMPSLRTYCSKSSQAYNKAPVVF
jgi:hypothetical protein